MEENKIKKHKTKAIIIISAISVIFIVVLLINVFKPKYKSLMEFEEMDNDYYIVEIGDYLYKDNNPELYDRQKFEIHAVKNVDPDIMVIAGFNGLWGSWMSYLCVAKDIDFNLIRDWEIDKITFSNNEVLNNTKLAESIRSDLLKEPVNKEDFKLASDKKINDLLYIHVNFKETTSFYIKYTIVEGEKEFYYVLKEEDELVYKTVNKDVREFIYDNFD